jgi:hypothetical protein
VAIYDSQTNYLGYFSGSTNNGSISFEWGLQTNENSPPLMDPTFTLDYYLFSAATGKSLTGAKPAAIKFRIGEGHWTPSQMMVACAPIDNNSAHTDQIGTLVEEAVVNQCYGNPAFPGGLQPVGWNVANGQSAWMWNQSGNGLTLLNLMPQCQFLYYFGHGSPNSFGAGTPTKALPWNDIAAFQIQAYLTNLPGPLFPVNSHPYKLVFVDGCFSGTGGLPQAFGIPVGQYSTNDFYATGLRARAFVGYTGPVKIAVNNIPDYEPELASFWANWIGYRSVHEIVTNCQSALNFSFPMPSGAVIYAATDMDRAAY